jgi:hypothetical protein
MPRTIHRDTKPELFWRGLIARWRASGQRVAAFCAAHRVRQATFYTWRKRLAAPGPDTTTPAPTFAPVRVVPDPAAEVALPTGLDIRVPSGLTRRPSLASSRPWGDSRADPGADRPNLDLH